MVSKYRFTNTEYSYIQVPQLNAKIDVHLCKRDLSQSHFKFKYSKDKNAVLLRKFDKAWDIYNYIHCITEPRRDPITR